MAAGTAPAIAVVAGPERQGTIAETRRPWVENSSIASILVASIVAAAAAAPATTAAAGDAAAAVKEMLDNRGQCLTQQHE